VAAYTALQLVEVLIAVALVLYGMIVDAPAVTLIGVGYLIGKAVLNILALEGGSVYRRSAIGYAFGGLVILAGLLVLHFR
jgi:hypothetical protein